MMRLDGVESELREHQDTAEVNEATDWNRCESRNRQRVEDVPASVQTRAGHRLRTNPGMG